MSTDPNAANTTTTTEPDAAILPPAVDLEDDSADGGDGADGGGVEGGSESPAATEPAKPAGTPATAKAAANAERARLEAERRRITAELAALGDPDARHAKVLANHGATLESIAQARKALDQREVDADTQLRTSNERRNADNGRLLELRAALARLG